MRILIYILLIIIMISCSPDPYPSLKNKVLRPEYNIEDVERQKHITESFCHACMGVNTNPLVCNQCESEKKVLEAMYY